MVNDLFHGDTHDHLPKEANKAYILVLTELFVDNELFILASGLFNGTCLPKNLCTQVHMSESLSQGALNIK